MKIYRLKKYVEILGRILPNIMNTKNGINLQKYEKNGKFNYDGYKRTQTEGNIAKIDEVFEIEENIKMLSEFLKNNLAEINFGICHGTRRGKEQEWFRKYLGVNVIGTEISETATQFPHTIQWDFHEVKDEWINSVDFIYSNSLDHSFDPELCLKQWFTCLRKGGFCILNGSSANSPKFVNKLDLFGFTKDGLVNLINKLETKNKVKIKTILNGESNPKKHVKGWFYCIIQKM